ncbi:hypothetical protein [EBPR siphovirus 1]|nr:hypothetical protein [EBPR siphovirus 1]
MSVKRIRISHVDIVVLGQHVSANQEDYKHKSNVEAAKSMSEFLGKEVSPHAAKDIMNALGLKQEPISDIVAVAFEIQTLRQELGLPASAAMARILAS